MIIKDQDASARLNSPMNLMNRLASLGEKKQNGMNLFMPASRTKVDVNINKEHKKKQDDEQVDVTFNSFPPAQKEKKTFLIPSIPSSAQIHLPASDNPTLDNLIPNNEEQVKLNLAHDAALGVLNSSITLLSEKLDDIRADKLPSVIMATAKVIEGIRRDRAEAAKGDKERAVHYHFYTPAQKKISDYNVVDVG